jgi:hypothetical protein
VLAAAGCSLTSGDEAEPPLPQDGFILYSIGVSSDPYGRTTPAGFGIVPAGDRGARVEVREDGFAAYSGATWIDRTRILVPRQPPPFRRPLIYRLRDGRLTLVGRSPLPATEPAQRWSPDGSLIASQRIEACKPDQRTLFECYRQPPGVYLRDAGGGDGRLLHRGHLNDWTPDGRLIVTDADHFDAYQALDVRSGQLTQPLAPARVSQAFGARVLGLGPPRWSGDGRYLAARVVVGRRANPRQHNFIVITTATGRPLRFLRSPYLISMFAWSPRGHRLAYTTSGFPDPHELYVVDEPRGKARLLFKTPDRHFDWVTWSPDGEWLLVDDEHTQRWRLFAANDPERRTLPRYGGKPLWCCPVNSYTTLNE